MNAVNMDTGYVNFLSESEKWKCWAGRGGVGRECAVCGGAYIEGQEGEIVSLYRKQMDAIVAQGGIPILFQTKRLHGKTSAEKASVYREVSRGYSHVLAFGLGEMFARTARFSTKRRCRRLMEIPEIKG